MTKRFFKRLPGETRFNHVWDVLLFLMMAIVFFTGVLVSEVALPTMGIVMEIDPFWFSLHTYEFKLAAAYDCYPSGSTLGLDSYCFQRYLFRKPANKKA